MPEFNCPRYSASHEGFFGYFYGSRPRTTRFDNANTDYEKKTRRYYILLEQKQ